MAEEMIAESERPEFEDETEMIIDEKVFCQETMALEI